MRSFIIVSLILACASAGPLQPGRSYRTENEKGNYAFGYSSEDGVFHEETGSPGMKVGSYGVKEADGTQRVVNYIADENGFRASVELKDQEAAPSVNVLVAQAQPVSSSSSSSSAVATVSEPVKIEEKADETDKTAAKLDDAAPEHILQAVDGTSEPFAKQPAVPKPAEQLDGVLGQPTSTPQQLDGPVPKPQDFSATVFFVPVPQHVAYSRVQSYSVHGFVPIPLVPVQQANKSPLYDTRAQQAAVRTQIPQVPVSWQYIARPMASQLQPFQQQIQSYLPMIM